MKIKIRKIYGNIRFLLKKQKPYFMTLMSKLIADPDHSDEENRFIILGLSKMLHLLVVCHCYRENEETIRIITARKAVKKK